MLPLPLPPLLLTTAAAVAAAIAAALSTTVQFLTNAKMGEFLWYRNLAPFM